MKKTRILVFMSLFVAMYVVLTYLIPVIKIDIIRISFGFLPQAFASMLFGPLTGGLGSIAGDLLGMLIAPSGPYFAGFTLSAFLTGTIYGLFLYNKPKTLLRIILAVLCVTVFIDIALNTYWLTILLGKGYMALLPVRIIKSAAMLPVQVIIISLFWKYAGRRFEAASRQDGIKRKQ
ncbi:MAG TPA: folate family ECF transporter S component [Clostridia bacterium]|nr:folate family ECF transporter S component [Clostridia bacterium]